MADAEDRTTGHAFVNNRCEFCGVQADRTQWAEPCPALEAQAAALGVQP